MKNLAENKELLKAIEKTGNEYYNVEDFVSDAKTYIKAIKQSRMVCTIESVSSSGMSRVLKFNSCEGKAGKFNYRSYSLLFKTLGYKQARNSWGFTVSGCGMDMVFHTNYTIIHQLHKYGLLNKKDCEVLAQMTPTVL
jgi:hypothetical protein